jgi:fumarate hydratase class II
VTAAASGQLELNLYKPLLAHDVLESVDLLSNAAETFATRFVAKLEADEAHCAERVERAMALATALNPAIGYDRATEVAKRALEEGRTVREVVVEAGYLSADEADAVLDPERMTHRGILGGDGGDGDGDDRGAH